MPGIRQTSDLTGRSGSRGLLFRVLLGTMLFAGMLALTVYNAYTSVRVNHNFTANELEGNKISRQLGAILVDASLLRLEVLYLDVADDAEEGQQQMLPTREERIEKIKAYAGEIDRLLDDLHLQNGPVAKFENIHEDWAKLNNKLMIAPSLDNDAAIGTIIRNVKSALIHKGNISNLALDPENDSFYLAEATVSGIPRALERLAIVAATARPVFDVTEGPLSQELELELAGNAYILSKQDVGEVHADLSNVSDAVMKGENRQNLEHFGSSYNGLIASLRNMAAGQKIEPAEFYNGMEKAILANRKLQESLSNALDKILMARLKGYETKEKIVLLVGLLISIIAGLSLAAGLRWRSSASRFKDENVFLEIALAASRSGLWEKDLATGQVWLSPRMKEIFGYKDDELPNSVDSLDKVVHPEDLKKMRELCDMLVEGRISNEAATQLARFTHHNGHTGYFIGNLRCEHDANGDARRVIGCVTDVTELEAARAAAHKANRAKGDFLANMSHELRTPLNSILGLSKIILHEEGLPEEVRKDLQIIDHASTSLLAIVNDILDLSKIESGMIVLEKQPFNVAGLLFSLMDQIRTMARQKGLELKDNVGDLSHKYLLGDEFRLSRILMNLLGNALKYTAEGSIELDVSVDDAGDNTARLVCRVSDTGIGITEDRLGTIFEKFTQAEESIERRYGGTGLGLNIAKQLTEMMGGTISVESKPGVGSAFIVSIPFELAEEDELTEVSRNYELEHLPPVTRIPAEKARILVAEDHEFNQSFILRLLKRLGSKDIDLVVNGMAAVDLCDGGGYDMVLMDIHMPEMNGYEAARTIRKKEDAVGGDNHVPIIAMTADVMQGTRQECLDSGMDEYISKPIDEDEFRLLMSHWFILADEEDKSEAQPKKTPLPKSKVAAPADLTLLRDYADDDVDVQKEMIQTFYNKSLKDLETLNDNQTKADHKAWAEAAHALKGSAGYVGAAALVTLCQKAQEMDNAPADERKLMYRMIVDEHEKVCQFLREEKLLGPDEAA